MKFTDLMGEELGSAVPQPSKTSDSRGVRYLFTHFFLFICSNSTLPRVYCCPLVTPLDLHTLVLVLRAPQEIITPVKNSRSNSEPFFPMSTLISTSRTPCNLLSLSDPSSSLSNSCRHSDPCKAIIKEWLDSRHTMVLRKKLPGAGNLKC